MNTSERKYGYIIFPESEEIIDNVWLNITESEIYLEVPYSIDYGLSWPIVLGVFNGMDNATFIDVFASGGTRGGGGSVRKFVVTWLIKHKHIKYLDKVKFKSIAFSELAFKDWFREDFSIESNNFVYTLPTAIQPLDTQTKEFKLTWKLNHRVNNKYKDNDIDIRLTSSIITEFNELQPWSEIVAHILKVKKLLIFLTNTDPQFSNIKLGDYAELIFRVPALFESRFPTSIELPYKETKSLLPQIFKTWFENDKLQPITDLLLEKHFHDAIPLHRHFFNLAVGLEAFHENFILKKVPISDNTIKINKNQIMEYISSNNELTTWFNSMSSNWVKPSLKDRLIHMKDTISGVAEGVFDFDIFDFITKIKKTRDEIAHAGIYDKQFPDEIELRLVTKIIEFVLRLEIYKMLEIEWKTIKTDMVKEANTMVKQMAKLNNYEIADQK